MDEDDLEFFYRKYLKGEITIKSIARKLNVSNSKISEFFNIKNDNFISKHKTIYNPSMPKLIKTEEENLKKVFYVSDWNTMTDEEKKVYL